MKTQKSSKISISVSLSAETRDAARQAAFDDNRPLSGLINLLLEDYLAREGYLSGRGRRTAAVAEAAAPYGASRRAPATTHPSTLER